MRLLSVARDLCIQNKPSSGRVRFVSIVVNIHPQVSVEAVREQQLGSVMLWTSLVSRFKSLI